MAVPRASYIEQAAADFGRHSKGGGGWALGLEVAACVVNHGRGRPRKSSTADLKVSAEEFARQAGTSGDRVLRHLEAWHRAAKQGVVAAAADIAPSEWNDPDHVPEGYEWDEFYDASASTGRHVSDPDRRERLTTVADQRGVGRSKVLDVASNPKAVAAAIDADPAFAQAVDTERARAWAETAAASLPDAPFDTPPEVYPGATNDQTRMDMERDIRTLHNSILRIEWWTQKNREMVAPHADRLDSEAEQLHMVAEAARGLSDDTLARILDGEDDLR